VPFTKWIAFKNLMARTCPVLLVLWVTLVLGLASAAVAGPAENLIDAATRGDMGAVQVSMSRLFEGVGIKLYDGVPGTGSRVL
jgi:hypothetical protein